MEEVYMKEEIDKTETKKIDEIEEINEFEQFENYTEDVEEEVPENVDELLDDDEKNGGLSKAGASKNDTM